jgi:glucan 1,3-beta-glucosidase
MAWSATQVSTIAAVVLALVASASAYDCTPLGKRCAGAPGHPLVQSEGCCAGFCVVTPSLGWGSFCVASQGAIFTPEVARAGATCTPTNDRCKGEFGKPTVPWLGCCSPTAVCKPDIGKGWGEWCIAPTVSTPVTTTKAVSLSAVKTTTKRSATTTSTASAPQNGRITAGSILSNANGRNFYGMTYSPFGLGDNRLCPPFNAQEQSGFCLLTNQVAEDMRLIGSMTRRVRTYSVQPCLAGTIQILKSARAQGMKVQLGLWLSNNNAADNLEMGTLRALVRDYSDVIYEVSVSNEFLFIVRGSPATLLARIKEAKSIIAAEGKKIPVGFAEVWGTLMMVDNGQPVIHDISSIVKEADFLGFQSHPWWAGVSVLATNQGMGTINGAKAISGKWGGKRVIISETGFPSAGNKKNFAEPNQAGQNKFLSDVENASRSTGTAVFIFEPFDGEWKKRWLASDNDIDYHFGAPYTCNRKPKAGARIPNGNAL